MIDFEVKPIFPEALIYFCEIEVDSEKILSYLKNLEFKITELSKKNNADCFTSKKLNVLDDLNFLKIEIDKHVKNYLFNLMQYEMNYKFLNSWFTKTLNNGFSQIHFHQNTLLSGVYYPFNNDNFKIKFHRDKKNFWQINKKNINDLNCDEYTFVIKKENTLILFPSDLLHNIEINNSNIERYSLAFNLNPQGFIGDGDSRVCF